MKEGSEKQQQKQSDVIINVDIVRYNICNNF